MKRCCAPSSRRTRRAELLALGACLLGCDRGVYVPGVAAEPVHVVGVSVGPDRPWRDGDPIVIAFDRYLDPRTATRQAVLLVDGFGSPAPNPLVLYDPETRTLTLANAASGPDSWLVLDQPYTLLIGIPNPGELIGGVRALDGGTLSADQALRIPFFARARAAPAPAAPAPVGYCEEIQPLLTRACARCHDGSTAGLDLRSAEAVADTALGELARGAARGALPAPTPATARFGDGFALLDPPNAASSYLLAKVLAAPLGAGASRASCTGPARAELPPDVTVLADPGERERALLHSFLQGETMPPPGAPEAPLSLDERRLLSRWIREGAPLAQCSDTCR